MKGKIYHSPPKTFANRKTLTANDPGFHKVVSWTAQQVFPFGDSPITTICTNVF